MATKRVIAYGMSEAELSAAASRLTETVVTDSYVIGDIDEDAVGDLEATGVVVDEYPTTPADGPDDNRRWLGRGPRTPGGTRGETRGDDLPPLAPGDATQWHVTLADGPLLHERRLAIENTGARLEERVAGTSYLVTATQDQADSVIGLDFVTDVTRNGPEVTGPQVFTVPREAPPFGMAEEVEQEGRDWDLWLSEAEGARDRVTGWLAERGVEVVGAGGRRVRVRMSADAATADVAAHPDVLTMVEHVPPKLFNDVACDLLGISAVGAAVGATAAGGAIPLTGKGQVAAVADTGLDAAHPDFAGRVRQVVALGRPNNASDPHGHGTHVSGSVLGDGSASGGKYRGVAPEATLYFQSLLDKRGGLGGLPVSLTDLFEPAYQAGARVHNNSWGAATESMYTVESTDVDAYVAERRDMLVVIAAGNEGIAADALHAQRGFVDWLSIGSPASCKNALTVGAARSSRTEGGLSTRSYGQVWRDDYPDAPIGAAKVSGDPQCLAAFSSRGPTDDRRIKPDVVAPGTDIVSTRSADAPENHFWGLVPGNARYGYMGGTSMATPLVSGCAVLVRQYYTDVRGYARPSAALLKATLINGTRWLSGDDAVADWPKRPNYHQGFGAVSLADSLPNTGAPDLRLEYLDTWEQENLQFRKTGDRFQFSVTVREGLPLRICLAYTDLPGRSLQNDVSLMVAGPGGSKFVGNADLPNPLTRSDSDNNVEVVRLDAPEPGKYLLQVFARNLLRPPQDFALVVTGNLGSALTRTAG